MTISKKMLKAAVLSVFFLFAGIGSAKARYSGAERDTVRDLDYSVRIIGTAKGAEGREILWRTDADMFSGSFKELGRAEIDDSGSFVLTTAEVSQVLPTYLVLDYYSTGLFVEPGRTYYLRMDEDFDYHQDERMNAFVVSNRLPELRYILTDSAGRIDSSDLNRLLGEYSYRYNRMISVNFEKIRVKKDTVPVWAFLKLSDSLYAGVENPFFQEYRRYVEASLRDFSGMASRKELFETYIDGYPINGNNPAQLDFLRNYFLEYFPANRFLPFDQVRRIINRRGLLPARRVSFLSDSMGLDYAVRNESIREWVLVYGLQQLLDNGSVDSRQVEALLDALSENGKFPENRLGAKALLETRQEKIRRHYFSGIGFKDEDGRIVPVDSLLEKGRFHYFFFVRADYSNCPSCLPELNRLRQVWENIGDEMKETVRIYLINCDYTFARFVHDARENAYPWPYLHFNRNIEWIRRIDASRFPSFFLVDDKGNILNSEFNAPSQNIGEIFGRMADIKRLSEKRDGNH